MFDLSKCILITDNDRTAEKWGDKVEQIVPVETYEEILSKTRDSVHTNHKLLTYPQASSLKPNQTPYRIILLYNETGKSDAGDVRLIEEAIKVFNKWTAIEKVPKYDEKIACDYETTDLPMIESVVPKL